ncbi:MAG: hypothetical protein P8R42_23155 [Candidatus Binatia bacterium]|nr:hypothetical protein [Candidatus Binatia bacterium]
MRAQTRRAPTAGLLVLILIAGCGDSSSSGETSDGRGDGGSPFDGTIELNVPDAEFCEALDRRHCLLPFPSDFFTETDDATDTGIHVLLPTDAMPVNVHGVPVDTTEWNRNDGFSPGAQILTYVGKVDLPASGAAPITDMARSLEPNAPIVLLDVETGERIPHWAEFDANVESDANRVLFVRPVKNLLEGHRHIVALRGLVDTSGEAISASDEFRAYRDRLESTVPAIEDRREHMEGLFASLDGAGVDRADLILAWDFTVASERNLSERLLHMRDDAFARLADAAPAFAVTEVEVDLDDNVARRITGTFEVPLYMTEGGIPGARLAYGDDGLPAHTGTYTAAFRCIVPGVALAGPDGTAVPARPSVYGHGLLGSEREVSAGNVRAMSNEHRFVFCATKWLGMSEEDISNAVGILSNFANFPTLADRCQQGILNALFLGRLMIHADGLGSHEAFQGSGGASVIDPSELFYDGNSQGGIMGGAATAVAIDWTRAVLGVTGMNYSILLQRSVDFDTYNAIFEPAYENEMERSLLLVIAQMLWDRGEANGYAHHITEDPLPGTPAHEVLMHVALGDHQVAQTTAAIEARTIGAKIHRPAVTKGRLQDLTPFWGIDPIPADPYSGSALVIWDSGSPAPPLENVPPREGEDPHEHPRADEQARVQKSEFLRTGGTVVNVCGDAPCMVPR